MREKIFVLDAIRSNRRRIALGVLIFFLVVLLEVALVAFLIILNQSGRSPGSDLWHYDFNFFLVVFLIALGITVVFAPIFWAWSYLWGKKTVAKLFRETWPGGDSWRKLQLAMDGVIIATGLDKPQVQVVDYPGINAISLTRGRKDALILVTRDAVLNLNRRELEVLLAHELTHVMSNDTLLWMLGLGVGVFLPFVIELSTGVVMDLSEEADWDPDRGRDSSGSGDMFIPFIVLATFWLPLWLAFNLLVLPRNRDELADAHAVVITHDPEAVISLIRKADLYRSPSIPFVSLYINHMFFHQPLGSSGFIARKIGGLFDRHPEAGERIASIESMN